MSDIKDYPKSLVERQFTKLQKHLLMDYKEEDDDAFSGTIRPEVMKIVQKNTPIGEILDEKPEEPTKKKKEPQTHRMKPNPMMIQCALLACA